MLIASPIDNAPIASEMRPPYTVRQRMSRPTSSLPNGCASDGAARNNVGSTRLAADSGTINGPIAQTHTMTPSSTPPSNARRWRLNRRQARAERVGGAEVGAVLTGSESADRDTHSQYPPAG